MRTLCSMVFGNNPAGQNPAKKQKQNENITFNMLPLNSIITQSFHRAKVRFDYFLYNIIYTITETIGIAPSGVIILFLGRFKL